MKTKEEIKAQFKADYPTLTKGVNDEVIELDVIEYEETIDSWVENEYARLQMEAEIASKEASKQALLNKLGITADEAKLLLS